MDDSMNEINGLISVIDLEWTLLMTVITVIIIIGNPIEFDRIWSNLGDQS